MKDKPKILKSILTSILGLIVFFAIYFATFFLVGEIILLLAKIPIISGLIGRLFKARGDTPDMMLCVLSPSIAYLAAVAVIERINKHQPTENLAFIILGVLILAIHIPALIINIINGGYVLPNITQGVAGIAFIAKGRE